jgi:hypothetical protein
MSMVSDAAQALLSCLEDQLIDLADPIPSKNICLRVGEIPMDIEHGSDICCEGFAWVRVTRVYPSVDFPTQLVSPSFCNTTSYAVELQMGVMRCMPFEKDCEVWTAVALRADEDAAAMRRALCCFLPMVATDNLLPGEWVPVGADGGCIGGTMSVTVQVDCQECP